MQIDELQGIAEGALRKIKILTEELERWKDVTASKSAYGEGKKYLLKAIIKGLREVALLDSAHIEWHSTRAQRHFEGDAAPILTGPTTLTIKVVYDHNELKNKQ